MKNMFKMMYTPTRTTSYISRLIKYFLIVHRAGCLMDVLYFFLITSLLSVHFCIS